MTTGPSAYRSLTWLITVVFLVGAIVLGAGLAAGSAAVIIVGGVVALCAAACGVVLPRRGMSAPISFTKEWPPTTPGPRGRHTDPPRIDTEPKAPPRPPPPLVEELHRRDAPHTPDRERSFAQHFNLDPHELLHVIEGKAYVELAEDDEEESGTLGGKYYHRAPGQAAGTPAGTTTKGTSGTDATGTRAAGAAGPGTAGTTAVEEPKSQTVAAPAEAMPGEKPSGSGTPAARGTPEPPSDAPGSPPKSTEPPSGLTKQPEGGDAAP